MLVDLLASVVLGLLAVNEVQSLGLNLTVDESTGESSHELLGHSVAGGLA